MNVVMNVFLANLTVNDDFTQSEELLKREISRIFNRYETSQAANPIDEVLFINEAYNGASPEDYLSNVRDLFEKEIKTLSADPEQDIANARAIAVGGGNIIQLDDSISPYYQIIRQAILNGVPYIGWNEGSAVFSALHIFNQLASDGVSPVRFHFFNNYDLSNESNNDISNLFTNNSFLEQVVALPDQAPGSGIRLEDSKAGLARAPGIQPGGGSGIRTLYIYEQDAGGNLIEREYPDPDNLPIM